MKYHENLLYVEFADFLAAGWKEDTVKKANLRNGDKWQMIKNPSDKRMPMVKYESLVPAHKEKLTAHFGNPYEYIARDPIRKMVVRDEKAHHFFFNYRYDGPTGNDSLPMPTIEKYTKAASWLKMLIEADANKKEIKKTLGLGLADFWENVCNILKTEDIGLPATYQRLRNDLSAFKAQGYEYLINARFGNKYAAKVNDELSEAMMLELISLPNQHDDTIIAAAYNKWATENKYKTVDPATVGVWRRKNWFKVQASREGKSAWYETFGKIIHRRRPTAPLLLVGSDDNDLDLYFIEMRIGKGGTSQPNYYFRHKLIVVMDAYNDYVLGYAYGDTVTAELVRAAYLDAAYHIKELTGNWYLPHQIQTDRWGKGTLDEFYNSLAVYTPAMAGVARAKYIESAFGTKWHQSLKLFPNYAGHNITAASKTNRDAIEASKKGFPEKEQASVYIAQHIQHMRCLMDEKSGKSRQVQWLEAFQADERSQEKCISDKRFLSLFGNKHIVPSASNPELPNTISNGGLEVTINGELHTYDIPDDLYLQHVGRKVQVIYDTYNLNRVLVTDGHSLHFVAHEYDKMSAAIADYAPGERARFIYLLNQKKSHVTSIAGSRENNRGILERNRMDAEGLLQAGVLTKDVKQRAELEYQQSFNNVGGYIDPLSKM